MQLAGRGQDPRVNGSFGAYQDGDGQDRDYGGDMLLKLTNSQFKLEMCSCGNENPQVRFRVKYLINP